MILITGASGGLGKVLFEQFQEEGYECYGTFLSCQHHRSAHLERVDVTNFKTVEKWVQGKCSHSISGEITLINCAGVSYNCITHKAEVEAWEHVINVNLIGSFNTIRAALPFMRKNKHGRIINFSSVVAKLGVPGTSAYAASKAGLWGLTRTIAVEYGNLNITANSLNLGYFDSGLITSIPAKILDEIIDKIPNGKLGKTTDIASLVKVVIENSYINGAQIDMNGGMI